VDASSRCTRIGVQAHAECTWASSKSASDCCRREAGRRKLLFRFTNELSPYEEADPFEAIKRAFKLIAVATTSTSALEARKLGLLRAVDRISMNRDQLIADAKARVIDLAPDTSRLRR